MIEMGRLRNDAVIDYFKVTLQHTVGGAEEYHENPQVS
jgi:hypothetical protein